MTLKKTGWEIAQLIRKLSDQLSLDLNPSRLFPEKLTFRFCSHQERCDCGVYLKVQKTRPRILRAVAEVFPRIRDCICHFHFLKAQGKSLCEHDYNTIRRHLRSHKLSTVLRKIAKALKQAIDDNENMVAQLNGYLRVQTDEETQTSDLDPTIKTYLLITWILEANKATHGFGFPFDRVHFESYNRLQQAYPVLKELKPLIDNGLLPLTLLHKVVVDKALESTAVRMSEKARVFDQLRQSMRIALPEDKQGLNDGGDPDIKTNYTTTTDQQYYGAIFS